MHLNFTGKISKFFLENRALSWLFLFSVLILGTGGYFLMPSQYNPEITLPAFSVQTEFPGATATEVRDFVTREMEEKIAEIPGVDTISSVSQDEGISLVRVEFKVGEDLEDSKIKLFSKINENLDLQISGIKPPLIKNITPDDVPVYVLAMTSENFSGYLLRQKAIDISYALQKVEGIANIEVFGGERKALKIELDPVVMKERKISFTDIKTAIDMNNGRAKVGFLKTDDQVFEVEVNGGVLDAHRAKEILVFPEVRLGEVAKVSDGFLEDLSEIRFLEKGQSSQEVVYLTFAKKNGANTSAVVNNAHQILEQKFSESEYKNIKTTVVRDDAKKSEQAIFGLGGNLLTSILIVSVVLYFFLGLRPAFLVALAIPLTLIFVFFWGMLGNQTINRITLFALILSLGLLVDSATVVVENIYRHLKKSRSENSKFSINNSIYTAVNEVGIGLFLSTLTSVIVFLPMTQISGMMGPYMGPLAFFVPAALLVSLIMAYTLTPFLASVFLKNAIDHRVLEKKKRKSFFDSMVSVYEKILSSVLSSAKKQKIILWSTFGTLFLVFSFILFQLVHFQMLPKSDQNQVFVTLDFNEGTNTPLVYETAEKISQTLLNHSQIESVQIFSGTDPVIDFNGLFRGFSDRVLPHQATLKINFLKDKKISSQDLAIEIRKIISSEINQREAVFRVVEEPPGPPVQATVVMKILSDDEDIREVFATEIKNIFDEVDGVVDTDTTLEMPYPKLVFSLDTQRMKTLEVSGNDVYQALSFATSAQQISQFYTAGSKELSFVELSFDPEKRNEEADLSEIFVKNLSGKMIPLDEVVNKTRTVQRPSIYFDDHKEVAYVTGEMENRSVVYAAIDVFFKIFDRFEVEKFSLFGVTIKDPGTGKLVTLQWGGEFEMTLENFRDLGLAMMVAFFLVYIILVGQFKSFLIPLLIMATVPLAMIGILPGFAVLDAVWKIPLTATALIGFIALLGIVVNNAIIYLEYLQQLLRKGVDLKTALVESGKTRLRPILLTSLTTVLGSLTIAADPVWSGLAWSIVFGLSLSAFLTLFIFPILYWRNAKTLKS